MKYLITHPGTKHLDDVLTIALALSQFPNLPVFFKVPTAEELDDSEIMVADIGRRYEPSRMNFDHHQLTQTVCAASLYLRHLGYYDQAKEVWPWFEHLERCDSRGPVAAASFFGFKKEVYSLLAPPLQDAILQMLKDCDHLIPGDSLHTFLRQIGQGLIVDIRKKTARMSLLERYTSIRMSPLPILIIDPTMIKESPSMCVDLWIRTKLGMNPSVSISFDERNGSGLALFRFDEFATDKLDFNRIRGKPGVKEVHNTGSMAWVDGSVEDAIAFITKAMVTPVNNQ